VCEVIMEMSRRLVILVGVLAVALVVTGMVFWKSDPSAEGGAESLEGWPDQLSMSCTSCGHSFEISSREYVGGIKSAKAGTGSSFVCPECGGNSVGRTENLGRKRDRYSRSGE
jgi:predicted RNA-binding Zn-ribbon protein involved in translation (DUF1610 family)